MSETENKTEEVARQGTAPVLPPIPKKLKRAPKPKDAPADAPEPEPEFNTAIFAVKTSIGHEKTVADGIAAKARREKNVELYSILAPAPMRGLVFIEGRNPDRLTDLVKGVKRARGMVRARGSEDPKDSMIPVKEIEHFLEPKPLVSGIVEGNIVEITQGPFKGEKARVIQIDEAKEEITVELIEAMISIPITVRGDAVRVLEKEEGEEGEGQA
jgi:transcription elongation factor SPT5